MTRWARQWRRLARDERGAAIIEFGFLGPLFLLTMLAVFDVSWMFARNMSLDSAARSVARDVRTGMVYRDSDQKGYFEGRLCAELAIIHCNEVLVEISEVAGGNFAGISPTTFTPAMFAGLSISPNVSFVGSFTAGAPESVMSLRIGVEHRFMTPFLDRLWGDGNGRTHFVATEVFQNEPFPR